MWLNLSLLYLSLSFPGALSEMEDFLRQQVSQHRLEKQTKKCLGF